MKTKRQHKAKTTRKRTKAPKPNPAAQALGRLGGLARKKNLSAKRASELGRRAAFARHGKTWPPVPESTSPAIEVETVAG